MITKTKYKTWLTGLVLVCGIVFTSCDSQLDIVPKGKVTLETVDELELLLNQDYKCDIEPANDLGILCGETVGMFDQVSAVLSQKNTVKYALMACDENVDRATLTTNDGRYNTFYKYINYMNVLIDKMPNATGNESKKPVLIAEARVMRAYLHWLLAATYAQQYDESKAHSLGGIPYVTDPDVTETKEKLSLSETYQCILDDVSDEVIADLPTDHGDQVMRGDKAWGYAVKAIILMQMKRYSEALGYAQQAIDLRPDMFDRSDIKSTGAWEQPQTSSNNFLFIGGSSRVSPTMVMISLETADLFEEGDYVRKYDSPDGWSESYGKMFSGMAGVLMYMGWGAQCNVYGLTSEQLHYVAAECMIRMGDITGGLQLVDQVRALRVEDYTPWAEQASLNEALAMKLLQQAKWIECIGTPFNYFDTKRWNSEPAYRRTITHHYGALGNYSVDPESPLWVQPFPANAVRYNPTLTQNY